MDFSNIFTLSVENNNMTFDIVRLTFTFQAINGAAENS